MRNEANDNNRENTDTSRTDKDDMSCTNRDDSIENMKSMKNTNDDKKYKDDNLQHRDVNESFINKTKEEESLITRLISMNFKHHVKQYVTDIVTSCRGK